MACRACGINTNGLTYHCGNCPCCRASDANGGVHGERSGCPLFMLVCLLATLLVAACFVGAL
jgi:hypothetical protein